jgi:DNA-binding CsgD family transcriptional regulator
MVIAPPDDLMPIKSLSSPMRHYPMKTDTKRAIGRAPAFPLFTQREIRCLQLAAEGKRSDEAANELGLSREDVNEALINAQEKLEASNLMHAVSIAMLIGVIDHSDPPQPK